MWVHTAMGTSHSEIIDKMGARVGGLACGANRTAAPEPRDAMEKLDVEAARALLE